MKFKSKLRCNDVIFYVFTKSMKQESNWVTTFIFVELQEIGKILTEIRGISRFTSVITRLMRNFPKLIPDKPGYKIQNYSIQVYNSKLSIFGRLYPVFIFSSGEAEKSEVI